MADELHTLANKRHQMCTVHCRSTICYSSKQQLCTTTSNTKLQTQLSSVSGLINTADLRSDEVYPCLLLDLREASSSYGTVVAMAVPRTGPAAGQLYLRYSSAQSAAAAKAGLEAIETDNRRQEAAAVVYISERELATAAAGSGGAAAGVTHAV
jgi:hypothetical protein